MHIQCQLSLRLHPTFQFTQASSQSPSYLPPEKWREESGEGGWEYGEGGRGASRFQLTLSAVISKVYKVFEEFHILGTFQCGPHTFSDCVE